MKNVLRRIGGLSAVLSTVLASSAAMAIPSLEDFSKLAAFQRTNGVTDTTEVLVDKTNPEVVYLRWDQVEIVNSPQGKPYFGFAYTETGGRINLVVKAGYSAESKATIKRLTNQGYIVRPLPVISGAWSVVGYDLTSGMGQTLSGGVVNNRYFETVFPTAPLGLSFSLGPDDLKLMVGLMQTGASLIVNYNYSFRAATPQSSIEMTIDQSRVETIFNERLRSMSRKCTKTSVGGDADALSCNPEGFELAWKTEADGTSRVDLQASTFSTLDVENLTRTAIEDQAVTIRYMGFESEAEKQNAQKMVEKYISATFFQPVPFEVVQGANSKEEDYCKIEGHPCSTAECAGYGQQLFRKTLQSTERVTKSVTLESWGTQVLRGHVGFALSDACTRMPGSIVYVPSDGSAFKTGCPTNWPVVQQPNRVDAQPGRVTTDSSGSVWGNNVTQPSDPLTGGMRPVPGFDFGSFGMPSDAPRTVPGSF